MSRYVSVDLRRLVAARADRICEYCLIHEEDTFLGCEVDHIISLKHEGATTEGNLAYSCAFCNRNKGSNVGSVDPHSGNFVRFFNPRTDRWGNHFALNGAEINPKTDVGRVTVSILAMNDADRLLEREALRSTSCYPRPVARQRIAP